jgi:hypothetical protein
VERRLLPAEKEVGHVISLISEIADMEGKLPGVEDQAKNSAPSHGTPGEGRPAVSAAERGGGSIRHKPKRRRGRILLVLLLALVAALYLGGERLAEPILRSRLEAMAAAHLNADLRIGKLSYHFPYSITVSEVTLAANGRNGRKFQLVKVSHIELTLAEFPRRHGPLVIEQFVIADPVVHLLQTSQGGGVTGEGPLVKDEVATPPPPEMKLSEFFRLRHFGIERGRLEFEDQTRPDVPPMVWSDLNLDLNTKPAGAASLYSYRLLGKNAPLAEVSSSGTIDVDALNLAVKDLSIGAVVAPEAQAKLPAKVQRWLSDYQVRGSVKLTGSADVPLRDPGKTRFDALLDLPTATARVPQWDASLDRLQTKLKILGDAGGAPKVIVESFEAASGQTVLKLNEGWINAKDGRWWLDAGGTLSVGSNYDALPDRVRRSLVKLRPRGTMRIAASANAPLRSGTDPVDYEVVATSDDFAIHPDKYPLPIEHIAGTLHVLPGLVKGEKLRGMYGQDQLFVAAARVPLPPTVPAGEVQFDEIHGSVNFADKPQDYPLALRELFGALRPSGTWTITGQYILRPKDEARKYEYKLGISTDHGVIAPPPWRVPITDVRCDITCGARKGGDGVFDITSAQGSVLGGRLTGAGQIDTGIGEAGKMLNYHGTLAAREIDLRQLAPYLSKNGIGNAQKLAGRGFLDASFSGLGNYAGKSAADSFRAKGEFEVLDGEFWGVSVIRDIVALIPGMRDSMNAGQAAATFEIRDSTVILSNAAVSSPALGLQGNGKVGFDGALDLRVVAAPLADWKDKMKRTGIPILSDAAGEVVGGIQKLLNGATKAILYEFRVSGIVGKPQVSTVPAPVLSDATAKLFGRMIAPPKNEQLIDAVREKK